MDGGTTAGTTAVAGADGIVTNDNGTMRQTTTDTFDTYLAQTTKTLTNKTISGSDNTLSNIGNSSLSNSAITVSDGSNTTAVALGGTMTFAGTTNEIEVSESSGTVTIGLPNNVTISGNLTVSGDTTTVNTATLGGSDIISTDNTKTLTNKTIVAGNNTISGLTSSHLASAVRLQILDSSGSTVKDLYGSAT